MKKPRTEWSSAPSVRSEVSVRYHHPVPSIEPPFPAVEAFTHSEDTSRHALSSSLLNAQNVENLQSTHSDRPMRDRPSILNSDHILGGSPSTSLQKPSPTLVLPDNQYLTVNGIPATTPTHGYFPPRELPLHPRTQTDQHATRHTAIDRAALIHRIPPLGPFLNTGNMTTSNTNEYNDIDTEMSDCLPTASTRPMLSSCTDPLRDHQLTATEIHPVSVSTTTVPRRRSPLVMGYRSSCEKCRCHVPGHYSHVYRD